jgi:hypothetical protein
VKAAFRFLLLLLLTLRICGANEETIPLFENHQVTISVPAGFSCARNKDQRGLTAVHIAHPKDKASLQITFFPDPDGQMTTPRAQKELMHETFFSYVETSREKAMQFVDLEPRAGKGTYCVFTDAGLIGKAPYPPGDFLHVTAGVKAWPGVFAVFSIFSNDTTSAEYRELLNTLRDSVQEKAAPLL